MSQNELTELIEKLNEKQRESAGSAMYHLAVLNDVISPELLSKTKKKLSKELYSKLLKIRKLIEAYGTDSYEGFCLLEASKSDMLGNSVVAFEINEDAIVFSFQGIPPGENQELALTLSSDEIIPEEPKPEDVWLIEEFYRQIKSILPRVQSHELEIENEVKFSKGSIVDNRYEQYDREFEQFASIILDQMRNGVQRWQMPWHTGLPEAWNPVTGNFYSGKNLLLLWNICRINNYKHNHWATWLQWKKKKATVKKGEKSTLILIAIPKKADNDTNPKRKNKEIQLSFDFSEADPEHRNDTRFIFRFIRVFNADQVNGYNPEQPDLFNPVESNEALIQRFIKNSKANIKVGGIRAYYNSHKDFIQMPERSRFIHEESFPQSEKYYSTLFHEFIHWTGHPTRCNRLLGNTFGSPAYAFEELVAELGGAILTAKFNNKLYPRPDHSHYLYSWLNVLEHDFTYFTEALNLARSAIYWLYQKTEIQPYELKSQNIIITDDRRIIEWQKLAEEAR